MAGRKSDPDSLCRMHKHTANHYQYAATVKTVYNDNGKRSRKYTHWGSLSRDLVFTPNLKFKMLSRSDRDAFIFPPEWDISKALALNGDGLQEVPSEPVIHAEYNGEAETASSIRPNVQASHGDTGHEDGAALPTHCERRGYKDMLYGSVWFLLQIAELKHVTEDLMVTFEHNSSVVNDILTLAIFPYLTRKNFDRLAHEQRITHYPSEDVLTSPYITRFTQGITAQNRMDFCKLRIERQPEGAYLACDSTTRSAWGRCIAEIHYGRNKDNKDMNCTLEVVVYSLSTHEPVYYRMFPGNEPDARTVRIIADDMKHMGINDLITIYDRGYETADNFDEFFRDGLAFISCAKVAQEPVINCLLEINYDPQGLPENMDYDPEYRLFYAQFEIHNRTYTDGEGNTATVDGREYRCNLFCDPARRPFELISVNQKISDELSMLKDKDEKGQLIAERKTINRQLNFHKVVYKADPVSGAVSASIKENEKAIRKARAACGFFSSVTYKAEGDAISMLKAYKTRDEQEKYFEQMKDQMDFHNQDCSSQDGKAGREFILFVGLILSSTVRNTWKQSAELRKQFKTSLSILDEMADIRWIQYGDGEEQLTSFLSKQVEICKAYGIEVPPECLSSTERISEERKKNPKRPGRKPKGTSAPNKITVIKC